jgi:hypothetical protein
MMAWAHKPGAVMHAEVVTDRAVLDEIHQFCVDNPMPRWQWHQEEPPYPSRNQLDFYFDRGNPIITVRDQDDELWLFRINSRDNVNGLWAHLRREVDEDHDQWDGDRWGGMTDNSRESFSHGMALSWALHGSIIPPQAPPGDGKNPNVQRAHDENTARMRARATVLFRTVYGPAHGVVV